MLMDRHGKERKAKKLLITITKRELFYLSKNLLVTMSVM